MDISGQLFLDRFGNLVLYEGAEEIKERIRNLLLIAKNEVPYDTSDDCYSFIPRERYTDYVRATMVNMLEALLTKKLKEPLVSDLKIKFIPDALDNKKLIMLVVFKYNGSDEDLKITLLSEGY